MDIAVMQPQLQDSKQVLTSITHISGLIDYHHAPSLWSSFQEALVKYGVEKVDIFQTNDLFEKKDMANVTNTIFALGRAVSHLCLEFWGQFFSSQT